jgi:alpha-1,2-mannosyltransferase
MILLLLVFVSAVVVRRLVRRGNAVGFLHPSSGAGGGGERVLWLMLRALMEHDESSGVSREYVLYTKQYPANGNDLTLRALVLDQFGVALPRPLTVVYLSNSLMTWTEAKRYPRLTLLLHSVGSAMAAFVAVVSSGRLTPYVYDTVGIPFVYPLLSLIGVRACAYVHYPVISTDMIDRVVRREAQFNNDTSIASSPLLSHLKLWYYRAFAVLYRCIGYFCHEVFTNSTWTDNHIRRLWVRQTKVLFPPCNVTALHSNLSSLERQPWIVSVGQFRPEKNHTLQLRAFARARTMGLPPASKLILVGGARNDEDQQRVNALRRLTTELRLDGAVDFRVSIPLSELRGIVTKSMVGLHCMQDEHFGIGVVEYLAAGCIAVAHNSGGVKNDIVRPEFGFLATTEEEFATALVRAMSLPMSEMDIMRDRGYQQSIKFSDEKFCSNFTNASILCR